jgi:hypothetical protein
VAVVGATGRAGVGRGYGEGLGAERGRAAGVYVAVLGDARGCRGWECGAGGGGGGGGGGAVGGSVRVQRRATRWRIEPGEAVDGRGSRVSGLVDRLGRVDRWDVSVGRAGSRGVTSRGSPGGGRRITGGVAGAVRPKGVKGEWASRSGLVTRGVGGPTVSWARACRACVAGRRARSVGSRLGRGRALVGRECVPEACRCGRPVGLGETVPAGAWGVAGGLWRRGPDREGSFRAFSDGGPSGRGGVRPGTSVGGRQGGGVGRPAGMSGVEGRGRGRGDASGSGFRGDRPVSRARTSPSAATPTASRPRGGFVRGQPGELGPAIPG